MSEEKLRTSWKVEVTDRIIRSAYDGRSNAYKCMVSRGVAATIPNATHIESDIQTVRFSMGKWRYVFLTPRKIQDYFVNFDAGDEIKPFDFRLARPQMFERRLKNREAPPLVRTTAVKRANKGSGKSSVKIKSRQPSGSKTPPKVSRSGRRTYGRRVMRENQDR